MSKRTEADHPLKAYFPIADAVAALFRPHVEVVIHDLTTTTIAYIVNPISKRKAGDSSVGDQPPAESLKERFIGPYRKIYRDGRNLRAVTAVLRDDAGKPIALMCMNFDVSALEQIGNQIATMAFLPGSLDPHAPLFHDNWRQALERRMEDYETTHGMPIRSMDTPRRVELIKALEREGLLNVRNAPSTVADRIGISRAALYKHLKAIREQTR